ncbi:flagellar hook-length control protein FliK [Duganella sp. FT3S]|uniref:Flagellar hook-length control protein FliK n=1 Tax=Rugamonas fusca TaxID=2758568 RepID=A0A7W2EEG0_9BURK|nr:flagellar hook-length control protein FliK [Rugamonas fusca]MBA5604411.1 flagellar hook-length control protein FliK [Rugamonas fusca]
MTLITNNSTSANNTAPVAAAGADLIASAPDAAPAGAVAAALPLFAQILNLTDADPAPAPRQADAPVPAAADEAGPGAAGADPTAAMASMAAAMLAVALPSAAPASGAVTSAAPGTLRIDALSTSASLNGASTRLDLSAAGVAVLPVPGAAATAPDTGAAAPAPVAAPANAAGARPAGTVPVALTALAALAASAAPVAPAATTAGPHLPADSGEPATPADTAAAARTSPPSPAATAASVATTIPASPVTAAAPFQPAPVVPARTDARGATRTMAPADSVAADTAPHVALAGAARDDGMPAARRDFAAPAPAPAATAIYASLTAASPAPAGADSVKLAGTPEQWQQPLREALGERLQLQLQRNDEHAVIRLDPPNMGRVEISIRHTAGALQVTLSANNSEVLRQLNSIGDSVRQDLSQRQFADVAVTVSPAPRGMLAGGDGNGRGQQGQQEEARTPGRALSDDSDAAASFAMSTERE